MDAQVRAVVNQNIKLEQDAVRYYDVAIRIATKAGDNAAVRVFMHNRREEVGHISALKRLK